MSSTGARRILIWGGRAQSRLLHEMIDEQGLGTVAAIFDPSLDAPQYASPADLLTEVAQLADRLGGIDSYVVAVGAEHGHARHAIAQVLDGCGLRALSLCHPRAWAEPTAEIASGLTMMPQSVIHKFARAGAQLLMNTGAVLEHECVVGDGVHLMGGSCVAGQVTIGDHSTIGTNATVLPGLRIGRGVYVGAGAVVTRDLEDFTVYAGVPAKPLRAHAPRLDAQVLRDLEARVAAGRA